MKQFFKLSFILALTALALPACKTEDPIVLDTPAPRPIPTDPTDLKVYELEGKYRSKFIYKWDRRYFGNDVVIAPPNYDNVLYYLDFLEKIWAIPYDMQVDNFMLKNMPKEVVLVGTTMKYESGDEVGFNAAGLAISSSRIILTDLNNFKPTDKVWLINSGMSWMKEQAKTMHHEFAHVLDKLYGRPKGFDNVSKGLYAGSSRFDQYSLAEANSRGFWIPYGMSNEAEDFATMVEGILSMQKADYLATIKGNALLEKKYAMVYDYYKALGIDIHILQVNVDQAITGYHIGN
ncbi:hypothetical protein GS399_15315 [Pedobacter sp. HMF7647]|uniref:Substrate import-associated zinc metallohydrolase lipoprotein n=1 Tax=Hufsiella arboris TaxID=2695275 RepID=A0A7K1YCN5_9SPHI|nr:substrate import-associated zinc metallohydrolase lipoprotein [Hufsiella arboris]MXV52343.1 hypothetical protein [Hufsiella arboris]